MIKELQDITIGKEGMALLRKNRYLNVRKCNKNQFTVKTEKLTNIKRTRAEIATQ